MQKNLIHRRTFLKQLAGSSLLGSCPALARTAADRRLQRVIFFYHPDGCHLSDWQPQSLSGPLRDLSSSLSPLEDFRSQMTVLRGINILDGRGDGHEEPARALLTGSTSPDQGSIDVHIADYFQKPLIHLGVQSAKHNGASISFNSGGAERKADDNPLSAYDRYFPQGDSLVDQRLNFKVIEQLRKDLEAFKAKMPSSEERNKLVLHEKSLEMIIQTNYECRGYDRSAYAFQEEDKFKDPAVPVIFEMQMATMVHAMKCQISNVGTLQFSRHTSPTKMDFDFLGLGDGADHPWPMESHQASHNNGFIQKEQKRWLMSKLTFLLESLRREPEPAPELDGSMLDHSLVVVLSEISSGKGHSRQDMPFLLIGGNKAIETGRIVDLKGASHNRLLSTIAAWLGMPAQGSYANAKPLNELLQV